MTIEEEMHSNVSSEIFENRRVGEWLSSSDAARFLGVTPNALRIMVCRGKVKYWKLGSRLKFSIKDLSALLQRGA